MSKPENKLQNLIDICEDAREFYSEATGQTNDLEMKHLFSRMAEIRKGIIAELSSHMLQHNMKVEEPSETFGGQINKFLGTNVAKLSDNTDTALIAYLEEAEDRCLNSFKDVSNDNDVEASTRMVVARELQTLQKTHHYMKELKDATAAAS